MTRNGLEYLATGLLICAMLGSCKGRETLVRERVAYDTTWLRKLALSERSDSVAYRERVEIVPRLYKSGDTTLISMDTTIVRLTERNVYRTYNVRSDSGRVSRDNVAVSETEAAAKTEDRRRFRQGLTAGALLSLAVVYGKRLFCLIRRMAIRRPSSDSQDFHTG